MRGSKSRNGGIAGKLNSCGYIDITINRRVYKAHRLAWLLHYGEWPGDRIDHIDQDKLNNAISNLRVVSATANLLNISYANKNSTSSIRGVRWAVRQRKYMARIRLNGKLVHLGYFKNVEDAQAAYLIAKSKALAALV